MKVAVIADTHGIAKAVIDKYKDKLTNINLVFILGDLYKAELLFVDDYFKDIPIIGVYGNHDDVNSFIGTRIYNANLIPIRLNTGTAITGLQGSSRYKPTQYYGYNQRESIEVASKLPKADILISHDGPFGYCGDENDDAHCGLRGINKYIEKNKPSILFYGHHHKNKHYTIDNTDCHCVYELGIFEIENNKVLSYENLNLY